MKNKLAGYHRNHWQGIAGIIIYIPTNSKPFVYYENDMSFEANSNNTVNGSLGLWLGHEKVFSNNLFFDKYLGIGVGFIQTDSKKPNPTSENDEWYSVDTINFNFGLGLRKIAFTKRSIGCFIEYNLAPYPLFNKVKSDFGHSSIITGISYRF